MTLRTVALRLSLMLPLACTPVPPTTPANPEVPAQLVAAAAEFQRDYEAELQAEDASFLTAVAAHYLGVGDTLALALAGEPIDLLAAPEHVQVRIGELEHRVALGEALELGDARHFVVASRQDEQVRVLVHDREAPARREFAGLPWFPIAPQLIVPARFEPLATREARELQTSRGVTKPLWFAGVYRFELAGRPCALEAFAYAAEPTPGEPLLIPFRDATTGKTSYGAGRYLEPTLGDAWLDFNRATNPLCAYSEHYNCPMPPAFNRLDVAIEAGARAPDEH
jgi:hypothetical protein